MTTVDKEVIINAPVEEIFSYISKPSNLPQIWPSLIEMKNEKLLPNGGYSFKWTYKIGGIHLTGTGECIDIVQNLWLISKTLGAIDSTITFTFRSKDHKTRVTLNVDYRMPLPPLGWLAEVTIVKMNDKEAELILNNLRKRFEQS